MPPADTTDRVFLFLQGPHGPFFDAIGRLLRQAGATVWRVGFNAGDQAFCFHRAGYIPYRGTPEDWPQTVAGLLTERQVTDLVLYGDTRPIHTAAIAAARARGLAVHVFEEGYLRPYWVTYERDGANGHSRLMQTSVDQMQAALALTETDAPLPPAHWGDMRQHMFYGALYHWFVMFRNRGYRHFRPHRDLRVHQEFRLHLRRLLLLPAHALDRSIATWRIRRGGFPYHLAMLQLDHDSSVQSHSRFSSMSEFLAELVAGFAQGAPRHHHLVVKAHPLQDDRVNLRRLLRRLARDHGLTGRVHFVRGGKLARLLDEARSAVTINSTAGQQALWRGLPLRVFGRAVYDKPEFVSQQPLAAFFAAPRRPDAAAYRDYRRYLLQTSQVPGGYYSTRGRRQLLRHVIDRMLAASGPYETLTRAAAPAAPPLRVVTQAKQP
ncbi:capsule biosynthesis protein [Sedimentitalea sp. HM32M-2]|uniref:capsule biosynthesis protein n=1 Tax=Sedimentitalea sp. HM32M-2 TaxID=3351566 RepID=UPI003625F031